MGTGYEYLIGKFADDAGHTAQEFYTNRTVVELMAEILQLQPHESIYDPTCGSGGMLIKSLTYLKDKGEEWRDVKVFGQEINAGTSAIARMNLYLHGIHDFSIVNDDTLQLPAFIKNGRVQQFNVVLANPPYSIKNWNREAFEHDKYGRNFLGTPPQDCADYAFIQHILASLDENNGRCAILLPHGVLFRNFEQSMRKSLIESDLIESVIGIGPNLFYNSPMEACILICNKNKRTSLKKKILFINALKEITRKNGESYLEKSHIEKIASAYHQAQNIDCFSRVVDWEEIESYDYDLTIQKYVFINDNDDKLSGSSQSYLEEWNVQSDATNNELSNLINLLA
jgi:type I restriction enzyme M protein